MAGTGTDHLRPEADVLLRVQELSVEYPGPRGTRVSAAAGVTFDVLRGETVGLVGESGCGKSTTARAIIQLPPPTAGSVRFGGTELTGLRGSKMRSVRPQLQFVFQDPVAALNPRRTVRTLVAEALQASGHENDEGRVRDALTQVGLDPDTFGGRYPGELSGGQCQRVCIARALVMDPKMIICDEPVSSLDVSVQAQILNLLEDLKASHHLTILFISHDLAVVKNISDRIVVMYLGKVCEVGPAEELTSRPAHPYTNLLIASVPRRESTDAATNLIISGEPPSPTDPPAGCRFHPRCPKALDICRHEEPKITELQDRHYVACHNPVWTFTGEESANAAGAPMREQIWAAVPTPERQPAPERRS